MIGYQISKIIIWRFCGKVIVYKAKRWDEIVANCIRWGFSRVRRREAWKISSRIMEGGVDKKQDEKRHVLK